MPYTNGDVTRDPSDEGDLVPSALALQILLEVVDGVSRAGHNIAPLVFALGRHQLLAELLVVGGRRSAFDFYLLHVVAELEDDVLVCLLQLQAVEVGYTLPRHGDSGRGLLELDG
jgi:hypothetical protein